MVSATDMSHPTIHKVTDPYRKLANAVLIQTLKDCISLADGSMKYLRLGQRHERDVRRWLSGKETYPGSLLFWFGMTGLEEPALKLFVDACFEILDTGTIPDIVYDWTDPTGHFARFGPHSANKH